MLLQMHLEIEELTQGAAPLVYFPSVGLLPEKVCGELPGSHLDFDSFFPQRPLILWLWFCGEEILYL